MAIVVNYHDDLNEVQGDAALVASSTLGPFDRIAWWRNLQENCALHPLIAVASDGQHRALLPLMRRGREIVALANWYNFTVRPLWSNDADPAALFTAMAKDLAGQSPHVTLSPLPDEDASTSMLEACFKAAGWTVFRTQCDINHVLEVAGRSFAEYMAARPGQLRTTLKRKAGKVAVTLATGFDPALWEAYEAVYDQSWKPEEGSPAFLRRFAEEEGAAGRLRMAVAHADGTPVAAQFWTVEHHTAFIHKLAHTESAKTLSPGTTLSAALFEQVIDRDKVARVDFGTGDNPYKRDWMESQRPRYRLEMFRPGYPGNWPKIARRALRGLAAGAPRG